MNEMQTSISAYSLLHNAEAREDERKWLEKLQNRDWTDPISRKQHQNGISVIIPAYLAASTIRDAIESLAVQTMENSQFEVIVVCNGPDDGTVSTLSIAQSNYPNLQLRVFHLDVANAGAARNLGLSMARYEYISFVDADDRVESRFLSNIFQKASEDRVVVSPIINCSEDGFDKKNSLNARINAASGTSVPLVQVPWLLGFNACKLVSIRHLARFDYETKLQSGEDLVFFANLLTIPGLIAAFPENLDEAAYLRSIRPDSVSRQSESFDFNVRQRVDCITALRAIAVPEPHLSARQSLEKAQLGFVQRYIEANPSDAEQLEHYLAETGFLDFPWHSINAGKANGLAISYCFSPFSDTSAVVAEKAIAERRICVDVISNDMAKVRRKDPSVSFLSSRWVDRRILIDTTPSFAGWESISSFAEKALSEAESLNRVKSYKTIYSRALWVGSHVAAALFKSRNPEVYWTAEFSDPLRFGVSGEKRPGALIGNEVAKILYGFLAGTDIVKAEIETLFDLVEASTLAYADEVIFTNENQLNYMLSPYPTVFQEAVREKSVVRPHPVPDRTAYFAVESSYAVSPSRINIGYFGSFYKNRGLSDVFTALLNSGSKVRSQVLLHVFSNSVEEATRDVKRWGLEDLIRVNPYLPYMEFLNATTKFDVLLVNDISRDSSLDINPFLPSKLSDYRGSGAKVWGMVDSGSPLSQVPLDFKSSVGNSVEALKTFERIVTSFRRAHL